MKYMILEHTHDEVNEVYRLVVGAVEEEDRPLPDEDAATTAKDDFGEVVTEPQVNVVATEDFVFSSFDDRWAGMEPDEIAKRQRTTVKRALLRREREAASAPVLTTLPGVGEVL